MRRVRRLALSASAAVAIVLLFLVAGQTGSAIASLQVFRANVHGLAIGDYHGAVAALAPLSQRVIDDANRDVMSTPVPSASPWSTATPEPEPVVASPVPSQQLPSPMPTSAPTPTPTPVSTTVPTGSITGTVQDSQTAVGIANAWVALSPTGLSTVSSSNGAFSFASVPAGTYTLTVSATVYQTASASITVTPAHNPNLNLPLPLTTPSGSLQAVVKRSATAKTIPRATSTLIPGVLPPVT